MNWQPIETAPKDGTTIIGWRYFPVAIRWVPDPEWSWESVHLGGCLPLHSNGFVDGDRALTHWMPLPDSPEDEDHRYTLTPLGAAMLEGKKNG